VSKIDIKNPFDHETPLWGRKKGISHKIPISNFYCPYYFGHGRLVPHTPRSKELQEMSKELLDAGAPPPQNGLDPEHWPDHPRQGRDEWPMWRKVQAKQLIDGLLEEHRQNRATRAEHLDKLRAEHAALAEQEWADVVSIAVQAVKHGTTLRDPVNHHTYFKLRREVSRRLHQEEKDSQ
jgi:hypothetical protein